MTTTVYKAYFTMEGEGCLMMVHPEKNIPYVIKLHPDFYICFLMVI